MTQDEIIEMVMQISGCDRPEDDSPALKMFVAFAKLVAAKATASEREACAKVCDVLAYHPEFASDVTKLAAMAIRARGEA